MRNLEDRLSQAIAQAMIYYRDIPEMNEDSHTIVGITARETWLVNTVVALIGYELVAHGEAIETQRKAEAVQALKAAAQRLAESFPDDPSQWPDNLFGTLMETTQALDKAEEAEI